MSAAEGVPRKDWWQRHLRVPFVWGGRDYDGADCYGHVFLGYRDVLGIELPTYQAEQPNDADRCEIRALIVGQAHGGPWVQVNTPQPFDAVVLDRGLGMGLMIDAERFLSARRGAGVFSASWRDPEWNRRILRILRHRTRL